MYSDKIKTLLNNCHHLYNEALKSDSPLQHRIYFLLIEKIEREIKTLEQKATA